MGLKLRPCWPKIAPCLPKLAQVGPRWPKKALSKPQVGFNLAQVGAKLAPSWLQVGSKLAQDGLKSAEVGQSWPKLATFSLEALFHHWRWSLLCCRKHQKTLNFIVFYSILSKFALFEMRSEKAGQGDRKINEKRPNLGQLGTMLGLSCTKLAQVGQKFARCGPFLPRCLQKPNFEADLRNKEAAPGPKTLRSLPFPSQSPPKPPSFLSQSELLATTIAL